MTAGVVLARTEDRMTVVARHLEQGLSLSESAALLDVTPRTVSRFRAKLRGYTLPPAPKPTPERIAEWERLLDDGWSYKEISRTHHVSEDTIRHRLPGRGWDRTTVGQAGAAGRLMNNLPDRLEETKKVTFATMRPHKFRPFARRGVRGRHIYNIPAPDLYRQAQTIQNGGQRAATQTFTARTA